MIARLRRLSDRDWDVLDQVLAGVLFVLMALGLALSHHRGSVVIEILVAAAIALALLWRRRNPLLSAIVVVAGAVVVLAVLSSPNNASAVTLAVIVASYSTGAHLDLRRSLVGFVLIVAGIATVCAIKSPKDIFFPVVFFGIVPWAVGRVLRTQTALARELTEKAEHEQIARDEEEARATAAERARVARELHDVLAHNLSVMVIQASAARRIAGRDPAAATEAAGLIGRTGREALGELRFLFGPVRHQDGDELGAAPGLASLDQLISRAHRAGLPVEARIEGTPIELSPGADLAAYRVIQEALTNTLRHAGGSRATVLVRYGPQEVVVEVLDDGAGHTTNGKPTEGGGHGLMGMRERVALYGGEVRTARRTNGGFAVWARLPARRAAA